LVISQFLLCTDDYEDNFLCIFNVPGLLWPIDGQESILRFVDDLFPYTWTVTAAEGIALRDYSVTEESVWKGFGMTSAWIIIFNVVIGCIIKYRPSALVGN